MIPSFDAGQDPELDRDHTLKVVIMVHEDTVSVLLGGEADLASADYLKTVLTCPELNHAGHVHLHASDLEFCDVAALRELALLARLARLKDRDVTTFDAPPLLRQMARMMNVEEDLGLR